MEWTAGWMVLAATAGEAAAEAGGNPLQFNFATFLFQALNVLIVMYILYRLLFKPLGEAIAKREQHVAGALDGARQAKAEAERLRDEMRDTLEQSRRRAQEELERARQSAEQERATRLKAADEEVRRMLDAARAEIRAEREQALVAIREEAANLTVLAAGRLLRRSITAEDQRRLAQEFVRQVGELQ